MARKRADMTLDEARTCCLEQERDRMRKHGETQQGRFDASMVSIDAMTAGFDDPSKATCLSDGGVGAAAITDDGSRAAAWRNRRDYAALKLKRAGKKHLVPVFLLICKNGNNREESIWELAHQKTGPFRRLYCDHRKKLLIFFSAQ